jgi:hypothetical protein
MKKQTLATIVACGIIATVLMACSAKPTQESAKIKITCRIAAHSTDCFDRGGLCDCRLSFLTVGRDTSMRERNLSVEVVNDELYAYFADPLPRDASSKFEFDKPTPLTDSISNKLGYKTVTIQPGNYAVKTENKTAIVKLKILTQ